MRLLRIILFAAIHIVVLAFFTVPDFRAALDEGMAVISGTDLQAVVEYFQGYGSLSALASFFFMILQAVLLPLPSILITLSNAEMFGGFLGAILTWTSSMVGAAFCFYVSRVFMRDLVSKLIGKTASGKLDAFFNKYGIYTILIVRLIPFINFDLVSYAAGLTSMKLKPFLIATGIGQLPAIIFYSFFAQESTTSGQGLFIGLSLFLAVAVILYIGKNIYRNRQAKQTI